MPGDEKQNEDAIEKVRSNPNLAQECKVKRDTVPRYDNEIGNDEGTSCNVFQEFQPVAFFILHREQRPRRWFIRLVTWPYFERISIFVILVNCVTLGMYDPFDKDCKTQRCQILESMEKFIYAFFLAEMLCKWIAMGLFGKTAYFAESWNRLDCFIVAAGTFELLYNQGEYLSAVRAIRVLRPLRAINRVPSIRILVTLLLDTLPMLWNVLAICFFIFAIFGIVAVQLWQGTLRGRCFHDLPKNVSERYNLPDFYRPSDKPDFVCTMPNANGMQTCTNLSPVKHNTSGRDCTLSYKAIRSNNSNNCVNWNQHYTQCKKEGDNPEWGAIGFDNIFLAWVAIFQVITLEGWADIMYYVQDAHGLWNWIYFVVLIVIASYFMTNLCLVVITTQFQETKQRENELLRQSRRRVGTSTSTISSSRYGKDGCWIEILRYIEHLFRRFKRRLQKRFNWKYCESANIKTKTSRHRKRRRRKKKLVYHHHHHHHHHHHYHHHVHCTDPGCPCGNVGQQFPLHPGNTNLTPNESSVDVQRLQTKQDKPVANMLTVPGQVPSTGKHDNGDEPEGLQTISIVTGSSCSVRKEPSSTSHAGEMFTTATAAVAINGKSAVADIATHTFLSAASLSSVAATATASAAAASAIHNVCACAVEHVEEDIKVDYEYEEEGGSESEFTDNDDDEIDVDNQLKEKPFARFRHLCRQSVDSKWFMYVIMGSIFLNTLSMGIEYHGQPQKMTDVLEILNYIFTAIFGIEMLLKLLGMGPYGYIKDPFNLFDGFIVIMSIAEVFGEGDSSISVLRSFRLLRIFKLVRFLPALKRQLMVMIHTMDNVMTFLALLVLFIFTASILGMNLFGGKYNFDDDENGIKEPARANFDDLFWALVTVFQVLTQEDWNTVMYDGMRATSKWAALYFILLMTIGNYILFNLLVAILVEGFANQPEKGGSTWSVKSKSSRHDGDSSMYPELIYPMATMVTPRVCVSPTPSLAKMGPAGSHDDLRRDDHRNAAEPVHRLRCSYPSLSPKCSLFRDECHASAPTSPASTSPRIARKTLSFGDTTTMVIANPAQVERCITSDDENEMSAREEDETVVRIQDGSTCFYRRRDWSLYLLSPSNKFRKSMDALYRNKWFDRVVLAFILLNCVVMALERPDLAKDSTLKKFIVVCMYIFLGIFTIEMFIKVIALGLWIGPYAYLRSAWNVMDGFLVVVSWIDVIVDLTTDTQSSILGVLRVFRALRTLRPLRVISRAPGLKIVVETLISSLKPIGNIVLIAATFFIIFGILGVQLFKGKFYYCKDASYPEVATKEDCQRKGFTWENKEYNFDNLAKALLTLFVFSTKDGWVTIMYDGIDAVDIDKEPIKNHNKWNVLFFVAFLLLAGFVVLNMLVGVVVENFQKCRDMIEKDRLAEREKARVMKLQSEADREDAEEFPQPRRFFHRICTHGYFDLGISAVIVLNVICMAAEHYNQPEELKDFLRYANYVFTAIFILEGILKIYSLGLKKYIKERWNQLDLLIIVLSVVGIVLEEMDSDVLPINPTIIRVMRVLRIARVLKLLKTAEGIRKLLDTVAEALPQVGNLGLLFLLMFFIFAALGMELFGQINCTDTTVPCEGLDNHAHFKNFGFAMLTLFRVSTGDNWNGILKDIINKKRCEENDFPGCSALEHIAPIYFAVFVLATQFVLLNVVVAVLMKHLEEAKEEKSLNSSREGEDDVLAMQTHSGVGAGPGPAQEICKEGDYGTRQAEGVLTTTESNNNAMVIPVVGIVNQTNDSDSSLSSIEHTVHPARASADSRRRLPPVDQAHPNRSASASLATLRLPPIGSQANGLDKSVRSSDKIDRLTLSSPENEKPVRNQNDGNLSPRAPIYVMSEDSDLYDSNMEVDQEPSKVFRPVQRSPAPRSPSPHSSSEDEGKKSFFKKPYHKSESKRAKSSKKEPKATASVSPRPATQPEKQETKPVKPDARWASPVFGGVEQGQEEMKLRVNPKPENDDNNDKSYQMQSYV